MYKLNHSVAYKPILFVYGCLYISLTTGGYPTRKSKQCISLPLVEDEVVNEKWFMLLYYSQYTITTSGQSNSVIENKRSH